MPRTAFAPVRRTQPTRLRTPLAAAAALSEQELEKRALKLDVFDGAAVQQAVQQLRGALGSDTQALDDATLEWFLRDRKLDVDKTVTKARANGGCTQPWQPS